MTIWMILFASWSAGASCVTDLNYPTELTLPSLERWSKNSLFRLATPETECRMVQSLIGSFDVLGEKTKGEGPRYRRLRGTHSKGVCFEGSFRPQFDAHLSEKRKAVLRQAEVLSAEHKRSAFIRFANGASHIQPDWAKDVRALSFRVQLQGGSTQDFSFNNVARFQIDDLYSFSRVMEMSAGMITGEIEKDGEGPKMSSLFNYMRDRHGSFGAVRAMVALNKVKGLADSDQGFHDSYLTQGYWSTTPFAIGPSNRHGEVSRVVRFGAVPCGERRAPLGSEEEARATSYLRGVERENFLGEDLIAAVKYKPRCFHVFAQFLEDERSTGRGGSRRAAELVEDASIKWDAPNLTIGELLVEKVVDEQTCDDPHFGVNVSRNQSGIVGVGALNRARAFVEANSQEKR